MILNGVSSSLSPVVYHSVSSYSRVNVISALARSLIPKNLHDIKFTRTPYRDFELPPNLLSDILKISLFALIVLGIGYVFYRAVRLCMNGPESRLKALEEALAKAPLGKQESLRKRLNDLELDQRLTADQRERLSACRDKLETLEQTANEVFELERIKYNVPQGFATPQKRANLEALAQRLSGSIRGKVIRSIHTCEDIEKGQTEIPTLLLAIKDLFKQLEGCSDGKKISKTISEIEEKLKSASELSDQCPNAEWNAKIRKFAAKLSNVKLLKRDITENLSVIDGLLKSAYNQTSDEEGLRKIAYVVSMLKANDFAVNAWAIELSKHHKTKDNTADTLDFSLREMYVLKKSLSAWENEAFKIRVSRLPISEEDFQIKRGEARLQPLRHAVQALSLENFAKHVTLFKNFHVAVLTESQKQEFVALQKQFTAVQISVDLIEQFKLLRDKNVPFDPQLFNLQVHLEAFKVQCAAKTEISRWQEQIAAFAKDFIEIEAIFSDIQALFLIPKSNPNGEEVVKAIDALRKKMSELNSKYQYHSYKKRWEGRVQARDADLKKLLMGQRLLLKWQDDFVQLLQNLKLKELTVVEEMLTNAARDIDLNGERTYVTAWYEQLKATREFNLTELSKAKDKIGNFESRIKKFDENFIQKIAKSNSRNSFVQARQEAESEIKTLDAQLENLPREQFATIVNSQTKKLGLFKDRLKEVIEKNDKRIQEIEDKVKKDSEEVLSLCQELSPGKPEPECAWICAERIVKAHFVVCELENFLKVKKFDLTLIEGLKKVIGDFQKNKYLKLVENDYKAREELTKDGKLGLVWITYGRYDEAVVAKFIAHSLLTSQVFINCDAVLDMLSALRKSGNLEAFSKRNKTLEWLINTFYKSLLPKHTDNFISQLNNFDYNQPEDQRKKCEKELVDILKRLFDVFGKELNMIWLHILYKDLIVSIKNPPVDKLTEYESNLKKLTGLLVVFKELNLLDEIDKRMNSNTPGANVQNNLTTEGAKVLVKKGERELRNRLKVTQEAEKTALDHSSAKPSNDKRKGYIAGTINELFKLEEDVIKQLGEISQNVLLSDFALMKGNSTYQDQVCYVLTPIADESPTDKNKRELSKILTDLNDVCRKGQEFLKRMKEIYNANEPVKTLKSVYDDQIFIAYSKKVIEIFGVFQKNSQFLRSIGFDDLLKQKLSVDSVNDLFSCKTDKFIRSPGLRVMLLTQLVGKDGLELAHEQQQCFVGSAKYEASLCNLARIL